MKRAPRVTETTDKTVRFKVGDLVRERAERPVFPYGITYRIVEVVGRFDQYWIETVRDPKETTGAYLFSGANLRPVMDENDEALLANARADANAKIDALLSDVQAMRDALCAAERDLIECFLERHKP